MKTVQINYSSGRVEAETANNFWRKTKGMRNRNSGKMLFSFNPAQNPLMDMVGVKADLWMYGMRKLSDTHALVVASKEMKPFRLRDRSTWKTYRPGKPVHYILESFEQLDLECGDKVSFTDPELEKIL